ncbi:VG15 protein [Streptomyces sp. NPDC002644]
MSQADIDRASRAYHEQQAQLATSVMGEIIRWWRQLGYQAVESDIDALWDTYRDLVVRYRDESYAAGLLYHNTIRETALGEQGGTFPSGERDTEAEDRQIAASFFAHTAPIAREIKRGRLDDPEFLDDVMTRTGTTLARDGGRLAEQGGRDALADLRDRDPEVIGYYRRTDADPCGFCAMLASRGAVYTATRNQSKTSRSWVDQQDPEQYHPECHCQTLPLFKGMKMPAEDEAKRKQYEQMWKNTSGSGAAQFKNFRDSFDKERKERSKNNE